MFKKIVTEISSSEPKVQLAVGVLVFLGLFVSGYFAYLSAIAPERYKVSVTQTAIAGLAEATRISGTQTAHINVTSMPSVTKTPDSISSTWRRIEDKSPLPTIGMQAIYDSERQVVVIFGGSRDGSILDETWEFDGERLYQVHTEYSPPPRLWHGMSYDSDREVILLFGGRNDDTVFDDTWEFDGLDWRQLYPSNRPSARDGAGMTYDPCRQKTILFGGSNKSDTWEYDAGDENWVEILTESNPPGRALTKLVTIVEDSTTCYPLLFGGGKDYIGLNDLWLYQGTSWDSIHTSNSPTPRWGHSLVFNPNTGTIILFGGYGPELETGSTLSDTWEYKNQNWTELHPQTFPSPREQQVLVFDESKGFPLLIGNQEIWVFR